eukprot:13105688-Alexandrium_andersonii.AAC.1
MLQRACSAVVNLLLCTGRWPVRADKQPPEVGPKERSHLRDATESEYPESSTGAVARMPGRRGA